MLEDDMNADRQGLTKRLVELLTEVEQDVLVAQETLTTAVKDAKEQAAEADLSRREFTAIRQIAKLKAQGKVTEARLKLAALERVSHAAGIDLFNWQEGG
jgi:arabinogalactan endo-1,4-beta-galactosidase